MADTTSFTIPTTDAEASVVVREFADRRGAIVVGRRGIAFVEYGSATGKVTDEICAVVPRRAGGRLRDRHARGIGARESSPHRPGDGPITDPERSERALDILNRMPEWRRVAAILVVSLVIAGCWYREQVVVENNHHKPYIVQVTPGQDAGPDSWEIPPSTVVHEPVIFDVPLDWTGSLSLVDPETCDVLDIFKVDQSGGTFMTVGVRKFVGAITGADLMTFPGGVDWTDDDVTTKADSTAACE